MKCEEKLGQLLEIYSRVTLMSDKNGCKVIKIRHRQLGKDLVLHILPKHNSVYTTLCAIRCDNLPEIYDVFALDDGMLVLEEYIDGLTVGEVLESGKYKKAGVKRVASQICAALSVLHENGIVHRDIKPENVLVTKNGTVKLIDFNVARKITSSSRDTEILGTVGYAAPEQMGITQSNEKTDIYALGIMLNVMATGVHPSERLAKGHIGRIVKKCTHINPNKRYKTAKSLMLAL